MGVGGVMDKIVNGNTIFAKNVYLHTFYVAFSIKMTIKCDINVMVC